MPTYRAQISLDSKQAANKLNVNCTLLVKLALETHCKHNHMMTVRPPLHMACLVSVYSYSVELACDVNHLQAFSPN